MATQQTARSSAAEGALIERWIEPHPHRSELAEARIRQYGVPVWAIVGHWQAVDRSVARVAKDYELPEEAVEAALAYYRRHQALIDERLRSNAA